MAFTLKKSNSVKWPVSVQKATDGGKFKKHTFTAIFKELGRDEFNKLVEEGDEALGDAILLGWEGINGEDGEDLPFNKTNKKALLDDFTVMKSVIEAYGKLVTGGAEKN